MKNKRYNKEYEEGSNLLWPIEGEDKISRKFYRDLSNLSKKIINNKKSSMIEQIFRLIAGIYGSTKKIMIILMNISLNL